MDKIEKIRKEIERLKGAATTTIKELNMPEPSERMCGELDAYDDILYFLDTLQQEQQDVDLEKETKSWILNECGPSDFSPFADHWCADDIMATARHFYELGKNSK